MNTEFGELDQVHHRARNGRCSMEIVIGLILIVAGFGMAILQLLAHRSGGE